jgi:hypothetical protein
MDQQRSISAVSKFFKPHRGSSFLCFFTIDSELKKKSITRTSSISFDQRKCPHKGHVGAYYRSYIIILPISYSPRIARPAAATSFVKL